MCYGSVTIEMQQSFSNNEVKLFLLDENSRDEKTISLQLITISMKQKDKRILIPSHIYVLSIKNTIIVL